MSATGFQLAIPNSQNASAKGRSPLAHLLHALNQPLTGLQCSLELAVAGPRRPDQYVQTLREGLELTSRMRSLVEAMRELAEMQQSNRQDDELVPLDELLRETTADLLPVAETKHVHLQLKIHAPHPVRANRHQLSTVTFRLMESALSLTLEGGMLEISAKNEREHVHMIVSWSPGPPPPHSPFSPPELGLLIAQAGWEQLGAEWISLRTERMQSCTIRLPLACYAPSREDKTSEIEK